MLICEKMVMSNTFDNCCLKYNSKWTNTNKGNSDSCNDYVGYADMASELVLQICALTGEVSWNAHEIENMSCLTNAKTQEY